MEFINQQGHKQAIAWEDVTSIKEGTNRKSDQPEVHVIVNGRLYAVPTKLSVICHEWDDYLRKCGDNQLKQIEHILTQILNILEEGGD